MSQVRLENDNRAKFVKLEAEDVPPHGRRTVKVVLVGDKGAGKSKMLKCYQSNSYSSDNESEIHPAVKEERSIDLRVVNLELHDTASSP